MCQKKPYKRVTSQDNRMHIHLFLQVLYIHIFGSQETEKREGRKGEVTLLIWFTRENERF